MKNQPTINMSDTDSDIYKDAPTWDCESSSFPKFQEDIMDFCIGHNFAFVLFADETGITAPTSDTNKDFARIIATAKNKVFTLLKKAAGLHWPQVKVFIVESEVTTTKVNRDPTVVWANFVKTASATSSSTAGQQLLADFTSFTWDATATTHKAQVNINIDTMEQLLGRSVALQSEMYSLTTGMVSSQLKANLPKAFKDIGAARYRPIITLAKLQAELLADCPDLEPLSASKILIAGGRPTATGSSQVSHERKFDKAAGPWHQQYGHTWCDNHGWCGHDQAKCRTNGGTRAAHKTGRQHKSKADMKCFICDELGHFGRECPKVSRIDAEDMSKTALVTKYCTASTDDTVYKCKRNANGDFYMFTCQLSETWMEECGPTALLSSQTSGRAIFIDSGGEISTENDISYLVDVVMYPDEKRPQINGFVGNNTDGVHNTVAIHGVGQRPFTMKDGSKGMTRCQYTPDAPFNIEATGELANANVSTFVDANSANNQLSLIYNGILTPATAHGKLWEMPQYSDAKVLIGGQHWPGADEVNNPETVKADPAGTPPPPPPNNAPTSAPAPTTTSSTTNTTPKMNMSWLRATLGGISDRAARSLAKVFKMKAYTPRSGALDLVLRNSSQTARPVKPLKIAKPAVIDTVIATDTLGGKHPTTLAGNQYYQVWVDPHRRPLQPYVTCAPRHTAAASVDGLKNFVVRSGFPMPLINGACSKFTISSDGGTEYKGDFDTYTTALGCQRQEATAYKHNTGATPIVEGLNRIIQTKCRNGIFLSFGNFAYLFGNDSINGTDFLDYGYVHSAHLYRVQSQARNLGDTYTAADKLAWLKRNCPAPWGSVCSLTNQVGSSLRTSSDVVKQLQPRATTAIFLGIDASDRYIVVTATGKIHHSIDVSWSDDTCMQPVPIGAGPIVHKLWGDGGGLPAPNKPITNDTFLDYYNSYNMDMDDDSDNGMPALIESDDDDDDNNGIMPAQIEPDDDDDGSNDNNDGNQSDDGSITSVEFEFATDDDVNATFGDITYKGYIKSVKFDPHEPSATDAVVVTVNEDETRPWECQYLRTDFHLLERIPSPPPTPTNDDAPPTVAQILGVNTPPPQSPSDNAVLTDNNVLIAHEHWPGAQEVDGAVPYSVNGDPPTTMTSMTALLGSDNDDDERMPALIANDGMPAPTNDDGASSKPTVLAAKYKWTPHASVAPFINNTGNVKYEYIVGTKELPQPPPLPQYTRHDAPTPPNTIQDALSGPDAIHWLHAIIAELNGHRERPTTAYAKLDELGKTINLKMIFALKWNGSTLERFKARMCLAAWNLVRGVDYTESYSGVAPQSDLKDLTILALEKDWLSFEMDAFQAYLNSVMPEQPNGKAVTARMPNGIRVYTKVAASKELTFVNAVDDNIMSLANAEVGCRVLRAIYGHPAAGYAWSKELTTTLTNTNPNKPPCPLQIKQCITQPSMYHAVFDDDYEIDNPILILWINNDNIRIYVSDRRIHETFAVWIRSCYKMTGGETPLHELDTTTCSGMDFTYTAGSVRLSMEPFAKKLLASVNMLECNEAPTPLPSKFAMSKIDSPTNAAEEALVVSTVQRMFPSANVHTYREVCTFYRTMVMSINWFATMISPASKIGVSLLGRSMTAPSIIGFQGIKRMLRFVKQEMHRGLVFRKTKEWGVDEFPQLEYHSDASLADHIDNGRTQGGYCANFPGQAVSTYVSQLSSLILTSTFHAETHFASKATKDIMYKRALFREIGITLTGPTRLHIDNAATVLDAGSTIRKFSQQSKHFRIDDRLVHEQVDNGEVVIIKADGKNHVADALTKPLAQAAFVAYNNIFHGVPAP